MNNKGFTLIEALIGIVVLAVLMLGLTSVFDETLKKKKKLKEKSLFDNSFKGFGQQFQYLLKGADVATSFQMLPFLHLPQHIPLTGTCMARTISKTLNTVPYPNQRGK